jgi:hypothetical protein
MSQACAVKGCSQPGEDLHHWAPKCLFGSDLADLWPKSYLCPSHHSEWHAVTRTLAVRNHPDLYVESEFLIRPDFIESDVWHSWSLSRRAVVADLVTENPQVNFSDRSFFPLLDVEDWEGLCDFCGGREAFSRSLAYWVRAVDTLTGAIPHLRSVI